MASKPRSIVSPVENSTYRCPGCGELVDDRRMDEVLLHHQHVLNASFRSTWFDSRRETSGTATNALAQREPEPRKSDTSAISAEARLRRYRH
jgi:hypothetical protein